MPLSLKLSPLRPIHRRLAMAMMVALTGWSQVAPSSALGAEKKPAFLIFARVPSDAQPAQVATRYGKLLQALSKELGIPVMFQSRGTYNAMSDAMHKQAFHIVSTGPALYLEHEKYYEPIARPMRFGKSTYRGIILVRKEARAHSLKDLKSSKLGFVSDRSTSGYLLPMLMIEHAGVVVMPQNVRFYGGRHTDVVRAVTRGEVDAGAVYDDARLDAFGVDMAERTKTRVLATTPLVPTDPIVVHKGLDPALKTRISEFFVRAGQRPDAQSFLEQLDESIEGWVSTSTQDYDVVRRHRSAFLAAERAGK